MREPVDWPTRDPLWHRRRATPDRPALEDAEAGTRRSYRAFDAAVDGVAAALGERAPDAARVGILASTRPEFFTVLHAVLRRGETLVPLNARLTESELTRQAARAELDLLVCERATESTASALPVETVSLDEPETAGVDRLREAEESGVEPARWERGDTALVLFTSGTTGDPKGVRLTLGNLVASAALSSFRLGVAPGDRWLCCLPAYHMGGLAPGVRTALYGTTLVVQREFGAEETADALAAREATGVSLVPTQLRRLLDAGWTPPETLRTVLLGGAPAGRDLLEEALERGVPVCPTYGLTETASQVATALPETVRERTETVGQPLFCTEVTVIDREGDPLEAGEAGEIAVEGPTVTPGYLDAERTERAFGAHGLKTGDLGVRDEEGYLRVLGRVDDAILTGGEIVRPAEVADALEAHPGVASAAVVGLEDEEWGERVGALVVADGPGAAELRRHAGERLAGFKVPKTIGLAPSLPRTASGTVDREAVRARLRESSR